MAQEDKVPESRDPGTGLPPVTPPSGRFIAQLFLVPGVIVLIAVLLLLIFRSLVGGGYSAKQFLKQLDSGNADIRWRGASDLAQVLKRPESMELKADAAFALDLADRLRTALDELIAEEKKLHEAIAALPAREQEFKWRKLEPHRNYVQFLAQALGDFPMPVALPLLCEMAVREDSPDVKGNIMRRRGAVWALANLGASLRSFADLSSERKEAILAALAGEAKGSGPRSLAARAGLLHLDAGRLPDAQDTAALVAIDKSLAQCARADDRYLRAQVALACNFWDGALIEPTLLLLAQDDGHGQMVRIAEED